MLTPTPADLAQGIARARLTGDIRRMVTLRGQTEALFSQVTHMKVSKDLVLDYQAVCRRADRALGQLIRDGQARGEIRRKGDSTLDAKPSPSDFTHASRKSLVHLYDLADVSDERFEEALEKARATGAISRSEMIRQLGPRPNRSGTTREFNPLYGHEGMEENWTPERYDRSPAAITRRREIIAEMAAAGSSSRQMEERLGTLGSTVRRIARKAGIEIPADTVMARTRHHDSARIVTEMAATMEGLAMSAQLVDPRALDKAQLPALIASLSASVRGINQMIKELREETT